MNKTVAQTLVGQKIGNWTVLSVAPAINGNSQISCRCDCGVVKTVRTCHLKARKSNTCKCSRTNSLGRLGHDGYIYFSTNGKPTAEHTLIARRVLGRPLPPGAEVHHVDENKANNTPTNLVICPNRHYHKLLHRRTRALAECGHADWTKCIFCKQWDRPESLVHLHCRKNYKNTMNAEKIIAASPI